VGLLALEQAKLLPEQGNLQVFDLLCAATPGEYVE
jgi:hypothetical protein